MCAPIAIAAVAGTLLAKKTYDRLKAPAGGSGAPDPAAERAAAEASAVQSANAKLAADQRRRREQGSLLASGATRSGPTMLLGDQAAGGSAPALLSRGASALTAGRSYAGASSTRGASISGPTALPSIGSVGSGGGSPRLNSRSAIQ